MTIQLLIFKLAVQSSYAQEEEDDASDEDFDTIQWWIAPDESWRVRTFAIDNDIHVHRIEGGFPVTQAQESTSKHYGDIVADQWLIELDDPFDAAEIDRKMAPLGGSAAFEIAPSRRFGIWNPGRRQYSAKTTPP